MGYQVVKGAKEESQIMKIIVIKFDHNVGQAITIDFTIIIKD